MPTANSTPRRVRHRVGPAPASALYGYDYRADWPSLLSVAHDEADGSGLFLITDRPCVLASADLPLAIPGTSLAILSAATVLGVKFRLAMSGAVPAGAIWAWAGGSANLYDPRTGAGVNAAHGTCDDTPGPYAPPPPAAVVEAIAYGANCVLVFDRPVVLAGGAVPDDAVTFDGAAATGAVALAPDTLEFFVDPPVGPGSTWAVGRQPDWVLTPLAWPAGGSF